MTITQAGSRSPAPARPPATRPPVPCHYCGYDLAGHAESGDCSECGAPVALSMESPTLRTLDAKWVKRIRVSVGLLAIAALVVGQARTMGAMVAGSVFPILALASGLGWATLIWLTTTPHPALADAPCERSRRLARVLSPAPLLAAAVAVAAPLAALPFTAETAVRTSLAIPGAIGVWAAAEYPIALLAASGYATSRKRHPSWTLAATYLLAEIGGWFAAAAVYTGVVSAVAFYRVLIEIQVREVDASRRVNAVR